MIEDDCGTCHSSQAARVVSVLTTNDRYEVSNTRYEWEEASLFVIMLTQC